MKSLRFPRPEGDSLRVLLLQGRKVLASAGNNQDLVQLQEDRLVQMVFLTDDLLVQQVLPARCAFCIGNGTRNLGFVYTTGGCLELRLDEVPPGTVVYVLPKAAV